MTLAGVLLNLDSAHAAASGVTINPITTPLTVWTNTDPDPAVQYASTTLSGTVTCPAGSFSRNMRLIQDGNDAYWAAFGLGAADWECTGQPQIIDMSFYGHTTPLHPGAATALIEIDGPDGAVVTATRTVSIPYGTPSEPVGATTSTASATTAVLKWTPPVVAGGTITGYVVSRDSGGSTGQGWSALVSATTRSQTFTNLVGGRNYKLSVSAVNAQGGGPAAGGSIIAGAPSIPLKVTAVAASTTSATLTWTPPSLTGGSTVTGYRVTRDNGGGTGAAWSATVSSSTRSQTFTKLTTAGFYNLSVAAINKFGTGPAQAIGTYIAVPPNAPTITAVVAGDAGDPITASVFWNPPTAIGDLSLGWYTVRAMLMSNAGAVLSTTSAYPASSATNLMMTLPQAGNYRFTVQARNNAGVGPESTRSSLVAGK